jgi:tetratricopeptide (TPR) repeat protein
VVLFSKDCGKQDELLTSVWGSDAANAITSDRVAVLTLVDGRALGSKALAELPTAQRQLLKQLRKTQVLSSLRSCVARRVAAGVVLLRDVVASFMDGDVLEAAGTLSLFLQCGLPGSTPTFESCNAKKHRGEALEHQHRYAEAAVLYKECLEDDMRHPGVIQSPPLFWQYLGIALRKSGDPAGAVRAYTRGLEILPTCHLDPDMPEWRETLRLNLLELKIMVASVHPECGLVDQTLKEIFEPHVPSRAKTSL